MPEQRSLETRLAVRRLLRFGLLAACLLTAAGLSLALLWKRFRVHAVTFTWLSDYLGGHHASGIMAIGLAVLLAIPVARVLLLIVGFSRERDWRFAAVSAGVMAVLVLGIVLGRA